ncbi:putative cytochrome P450 [Daldinia caldariorum]|uniref:putative cytochrome P450 n=1 Tax=Daldinia caldariorum TaxID=326644 RepID=UPI002007BA57|nr:putative cytochrome P450 [Daldinia caldariorum]KAI1471370.1 putative cytochrome P450 [Daldinia caldariorum]
MEALGNLGRSQLLLIATGVAILGYVYTIFSNPLRRIPGPWYTLWTYTIFKYKVVTGQRPQWVHSLHEKYGPVVRITPNEVSIQDVNAVLRMYQIKGEFLKSHFYKDLIPDVQSVFSTTDVNYHRHQRRLLASEMSESGLAHHMDTVETKVRMAIENMAEEMEQRGATDVYRWSLYMATDVIGELSFGSSFRMLETKEENQYVKDLKMIGFAGGLRSTFPFLMKVHRYITLPVLSTGMLIRERMRGYATQSLGRHYKLVEEQGRNAKPTLLSKLYRATEDDHDTLPFEDLLQNAMAYIAAGSDTTTNTLTYLIWTVCKRPDVKAKLVAELSTLPDGFTDHDLKKLPYLEMVVQETLRLYAAAPSGLPRVVPQGGATLTGHFIPGGYTVSAQAYSMHRIPSVYPEPEKYDPSRWANPTRAMKDAFVPFGGGSRICIGLHLAKMELRLATARFFTRFPNATTSYLDGFTDKDMEPVMFFLMSPKGQRCLINAR